MNGRIYDPTLGRFLQADPFIQAPGNSQSYNRYSYLMNSPLSGTDPSGYIASLFKGVRKFVKKYWRTIAAIAISVWLPGSGGLLSSWGITSTVAQGAITGFIAGGVATGSLKGALVGAFTGAAFGALHGKEIFKLKSGFDIGRVAAHGAVGGLGSVLNGGKFGYGFLAAGVMQGLSEGGVMDSLYGDGSTWSSRIENAVAAAVVGGTVSEISGGKFRNGALTAAFSRLLNDLQEVRMQQRAVENGNVKFKKLDTFDKKVGAAKATLAKVACLGGPGACAIAASTLMDGINQVNNSETEPPTPVIAQAAETLGVDPKNSERIASAYDLGTGGKNLITDFAKIGKNLIGVTPGPVIVPLVVTGADATLYGLDATNNLDKVYGKDGK